ncbi:hypothetical protein COLO4_06535 [Corchorus olitorius]|uniref:Uncharacterized protein n=1 Tax=Corchorus olitorius TaxID=93759 RepID=A0A1R3KMQ8_9ROSI|nr:hypothetical protein COLO4_06535 [Corchorus olitorius]
MAYSDVPVTQTVSSSTQHSLASNSTSEVGNSVTPTPAASSIDNLATPNNEILLLISKELFDGKFKVTESM